MTPSSRSGVGSRAAIALGRRGDRRCLLVGQSRALRSPAAQPDGPTGERQPWPLADIDVDEAAAYEAGDRSVAVTLRRARAAGPRWRRWRRWPLPRVRRARRPGVARAAAPAARSPVGQRRRRARPSAVSRIHRSNLGPAPATDSFQSSASEPAHLERAEPPDQASPPSGATRSRTARGPRSICSSRSRSAAARPSGSRRAAARRRDRAVRGGPAAASPG